MRIKNAVRFCLASLSLTLSLPANADGPPSVGELVLFCKAERTSVQWGYCVGYIVGIAQKMSDFGIQRTAFGDGTTPRPRESLCPDGAQDFDATNMIPIFVNWAEHHPEVLTESASHPVGNALQTKWPCKF